jgi:uncharacterized protein (TIGR02186 family)
MIRVAVLLTVLFAAAPLRAAPIVVDLSEHLVAITAGFAGAEVLLFGAVDEPGDVVVIVRGPTRPLIMYRKSRLFGIWVNADHMTFEDVPAYYAIASTRPLEDIAAPTVLARNEMGVENLRLELPRAKASPNVAQEWRDALIRNQQRVRLYPAEVGRVGFLGNRLFRTRLTLPANVPTGAYEAKVYFLREGQIVSAQTTPLFVNKIGMEAEIFDFAYEQSALYGIIAILVALMAGWLAHVAFRRA